MTRLPPLIRIVGFIVSFGALALGCGTAATLEREAASESRGSPVGLHPEGTAGVGLSGVRWRTDGLEAAKAEAGSAGRTVFAFISTTWCGPCKRMKESSLLDPSVARLMNGRLVPVMLDGEKGEGKALCAALKINSYPTMVFIGPAGVEIDRAFGFHDARQLAQVIDDMVHDRNTVADLRARVAAAPTALGLQQTLGLRLALRGDTAEAIGVLDALVLADPDDAQHQASQALFAIGRYVHFLKTANHDKAMAAYDQLLTRFPGASSAREGALDLARLRMMRAQKTEALAALNAMVNAKPEDPQRLLDGALAIKQHGLDLAVAAEWATRAGGLRGDGLPWFVLGQVQELRGDRVAALAAYTKAIERSPGDANYRRQIERLQKSVPTSI